MTKKSKKLLVTGGAGFIGAALVKRLVREGYAVRVIDNLSRGSANRLASVMEKIEFIQADIRDGRAVFRSVDGVDAVIHLAFINGTEFFYSKPELVLDVGVKGMVNVVDACVKVGVKDFVLASSSEVYQTPPQVPTDESAPLTVPDPMNPRYSYGSAKIISEMMAIHYGKKYFKRSVIFRPHNVYGPEMGWEHAIPQFAKRMHELDLRQKKGDLSFPIQGSGSESRAFIFIDDFVDGLMKVISKGKHLQIYHIGTQEEVKIRQLVSMVARFFNRKIKIIPGKSARGGAQRRCPNISKLKALGFTPKFSLDQGLVRTLAWYQNNLSKNPI